MHRTSIRHNRFADALLIEQILSEIETIVRRIERGSTDVHLAESELRVAAGHLGRLGRFLPANAYQELSVGVQRLISHLQHSRRRSRVSRFQHRLRHSGKEYISRILVKVECCCEQEHAQPHPLSVTVRLLWLLMLEHPLYLPWCTKRTALSMISTRCTDGTKIRRTHLSSWRLIPHNS